MIDAQGAAACFAVFIQQPMVSKRWPPGSEESIEVIFTSYVEACVCRARSRNTEVFLPKEFLVLKKERGCLLPLGDGLT